MAPSHRALSTSCDSLKPPVGILSEIMANRYHGRIDDCYSRTSAKGLQIKEKHDLEEHPAFEFNEAIVGYRIRKFRVKMILDKEQMVMLEIAE